MTAEEPVQGLFDFESGNADGFVNWRRQQEARLDAIRREWSLPVGRRVRLRLRNLDGEFEGRLTLVRQPVAVDRRIPLHLRVDGVDVFPPDIEACTVVE